MIKDRVPCDIVVTASNDLRSYRLDSTKLLNTGFAPKKSVGQAILDIIRAYESGALSDEEHFYNLRWMTRNGLAERTAA